MKILITENQLEKVIYNYIERECSKSSVEESTYYFEWFFSNPPWSRFLIFSKINENFIAEKSFRNEVLSIFSLDHNIKNMVFIENIIKRWGRGQLKKGLK